MSRKFTVIGLDYVDYLSHAYYDLVQNDDVTVVRRTGGVVLSRLKKLHMSYKINRHIRLPLQQLWCEWEIRRAGVKPDDCDVFLFFGSPEGLCPDYLKYLGRRFPRSLFCLLNLNPLDSRVSERIARVEPLYHSIITCNEVDARERGWRYHPDCYSAHDDAPESKPEYDICFIGADKGRAPVIHDVYRFLRSNGLKCDFWIVGGEHTFCEDEGFRYLDRTMPYEVYLEHMLNSRSLLEITVDRQSYCTLRTMEAVSYGKRLVTTNASLANEPFFDKDNMDVFLDAEDIDIDALRRPYVGEPNPGLFSPNRLLEFICDELFVLPQSSGGRVT